MGNSIPTRLRAVRKAAGYTQARLATEAGVAQSSISTMESDPEYNWSQAFAFALMHAMGRPRYALFGYSYPPPERTTDERARLHGLIDQLTEREAKAVLATVMALRSE